MKHTFTLFLVKLAALLLTVLYHQHTLAQATYSTWHRDADNVNQLLAQPTIRQELYSEPVIGAVVKTASTNNQLLVTCPNPHPDYAPLVDLYNATNGPNWNTNTNWVTNCNPCTWYGIGCDGSGRVSSITFAKNNTSGTLPASLGNLTSLTAVFMQNANLSGSIPESLSALTQLKSLNLGSNKLTGTIPASLTVLSNLQTLLLGSNKLTGSIPANMGAMTSLKMVDLSMNQLTGGIPTSIATLPNLTSLDLTGNQLTGNLPAEFGNSSTLQRLVLYSNGLSGCVPNSYSALCGKSVDLAANPNLPGGGNFQAFCANRMGSDVITAGATLPESCVGSTISLTVTPGDSYRWQGPMSFSTTDGQPTLQLTSANQSGLYSVTVTNGVTCMPTASVSLTATETASTPDLLALNDFAYSTGFPYDWYANGWGSGCTPCSWEGVTCNEQGRVIKLDLSSTTLPIQLQAAIPNSFSALSELRELNFSNLSSVGGTKLPVSLTALTNLTTVLLNNTGFASVDNMKLLALMPSIKHLEMKLFKLNLTEAPLPPKLEYLDISRSSYLTESVKLTSSILTNLASVTSLQYVDLSQNSFSVSIPASLSALTNLQYLNLSTCKLTGAIPTLPTSLTLLSLGNNQLTDGLSGPIVALKNIQRLYLPNNQFSGYIPAGLGLLSRVAELDLRNNKLVGCFPVSLSALCGKTVLLDGNNIANGGNFSAFCATGAGSEAAPQPDPAETQALIDLYNSTNGAQWTRHNYWVTSNCGPCGWEGVNCDGDGHVTALLLSENNMTGTIPASLSALTHLQRLEMAVNSLSGPIQDELLALPNLGFVRLSNNQLSGCLPASLARFMDFDRAIYLEGNLGIYGQYVSTIDLLFDFSTHKLPACHEFAPNANQTAYVGTAFSYTASPLSTNSSPLSITYSASINPANGFTFDPATQVISGSPLVTGTSQVIVTARTADGTTATSAFTILVAQSCTSAKLDSTALADFFQMSGNGAWKTKTNWLSGCPCNWYGVSCNEAGRVVELALPANWMYVRFPASFTSLTELQRLDLSGNVFEGTLPDFGNGLTKLTYINLVIASTGGLTGTIPGSLSALTNLTYLDLSGHQLTGSIPAGLGLLTKLQTLTLKNNQLSGCFEPTLWNLCGKNVDVSGNTNLPGGGDFTSFCTTGVGSCSGVNTAPVATINVNQTATTGQTFSYTVNAFTDAQTPGLLGYSATINPTNGLTFDPQSRAISGSPLANGVSTVTVTATDPQGLTASTTFTITVNAAPCQLTVTAQPSATTINVGQLLSLSATGGTTYQWLAPSGVTFTGPATNAVVSTTLLSAGPQAFTVLISQGACSQAKIVSVTATNGPDLTATISLPDANFPAGNSSKDFIVTIYEVGWLPTSSGNITITLTAPVGYTLSFAPESTSINVSGGTSEPVAVDNSQWHISNNLNGRQLSLTINPGTFIGAAARSIIGVTLTRTTASSGSVSNITINVNNDASKSYDIKSTNNVYARILNAL
ncbi:putative Ig domain-containing protein [Spirosoma litoris]